jgi:hypothetical protein
MRITAGHHATYPDDFDGAIQDFAYEDASSMPDMPEDGKEGKPGWSILDTVRVGPLIYVGHFDWFRRILTIAVGRSQGIDDPFISPSNVTGESEVILATSEGSSPSHRTTRHSQRRADGSPKRFPTGSTNHSVAILIHLSIYRLQPMSSTEEEPALASGKATENFHTNEVRDSQDAVRIHRAGGDSEIP